MLTHSLECFITTPSSGRLPEFPDPHQDELTLGKTTTKTTYILSQPNSTFCINLNLLPSSPSLLTVGFTPSTAPTDIGIALKVDGNEVPLPGSLWPIDINKYPHGAAGVVKIEAARTGGNQRRKLMFEEAVVTEYGSCVPGGKVDMVKALEVGEVSLVVRRIRVSGVAGVGRPGGDGRGMRGVGGVLHEKVLKGRDIKQVVGLAPVEACRPAQTVKGAAVDPADSPFAVFRSRYRTRHALQTLGLIPRTPSPEPVAKDEAKTREELIEEVRRLREQAAVKSEAGTKRERSDSIAAPGQEVRRKKSKIMTIDLTDD